MRRKRLYSSWSKCSSLERIQNHLSFKHFLFCKPLLFNLKRRLHKTCRSFAFTQYSLWTFYTHFFHISSLNILWNFFNKIQKQEVIINWDVKNRQCFLCLHECNLYFQISYLLLLWQNFWHVQMTAYVTKTQRATTLLGPLCALVMTALLRMGVFAKVKSKTCCRGDASPCIFTIFCCSYIENWKHYWYFK